MVKYNAVKINKKLLRYFSKNVLFDITFKTFQQSGKIGLEMSICTAALDNTLCFI